MARIIDVTDAATVDKLSADQRHWVYNGLDVCITLAILEKLLHMLDETTSKTYETALALQAPVLEMMLRGLRVDLTSREAVRKELNDTREFLQANLDRLYNETFDTTGGINPNSPAQVKTLMYGLLRLPEQKAKNAHGYYTVTAGRTALEKLAGEHYIARPFVNHILAIREVSKALGFLNTPLDDDGRIRCNFNIAGTNTGRLSSSVSDTGTGTNLQNVAGPLRKLFVPDPGMKFVEIDLEQADSRGVGALAWNFLYKSHGEEYAGAYLDACESGDLHTTVCRMAWKDLDWPADQTQWRKVADQIAYRGKSYRDLAKALGHGTNYLGQPPTMAIHSKVAKHIIEQFQHAYLVEAFPCIKDWQDLTLEKLRTESNLQTLWGRRRYFFGRPTDRPVMNAAIAYAPQGSTGDAINIGIQNLWRHADGKWFKLLVQVHDSILFMIPEEAEDELVPLALELMEAHLSLAGGRDFFIPLEAATGWNWGKRKWTREGKLENKYGLKTWSGHDDREDWKPTKFSMDKIL